MTIESFDKWIKEHFEVEKMAPLDSSLNGIQVGRPEKEVKTVVFAVDACYDSIIKAAQLKADVLLVHHGLFWGKNERITGYTYRRIAALMESDIALYALHLPLDAHPHWGNNIGLAKKLKLTKIEPFGLYNSIPIGFQGNLTKPLKLSHIVTKLFGTLHGRYSLLPFGVEEIRSVAIVSGGATGMAFEAMEKGVDLYITGESNHSLFHPAQEAGINIICGGHYITECLGVQLLSEAVESKLNLKTQFIDVPTGL